MKLLIIILFLVYSQLNAQSYPIDTIYTPKNLYKVPTSYDEEKVYFDWWCSNLKHDTVLFRKGNTKIFYFVEDSTIYSVKLDSIVGYSYDRRAFFSSKIERVNGRNEQFTNLYIAVPYLNQIYNSYYMATSYFRNWERDTNALFYQIQISTDKDFRNVYRYDTLPQYIMHTHFYNLVYGNNYWGRVRSVYNDTSFSEWKLLLENHQPIGWDESLLPKNQIRMVMLRFINVGSRTQVMVRFTYYNTIELDFINRENYK
jgi:hypothetical protein